MKKIIILVMVFFFSTTLFVYAEDNLDADIEISSEYYYLINIDNHQVIFDHGSKEMIYPASLTKIMTLIVALENLDDTSALIELNDKVFNGLYEANASMAGFEYGEQVSVEDCLYGLFLPSGAECARALALETSGSESGFVKLMNEKAKELKMNSTHFSNTTGLHENDHFSTLYDMSLLLEYALKNDDFYKIFSTETYVATTGTKSGMLEMNSSMFNGAKSYGLDTKYLVGGKTGFTGAAGLCLASVGLVNDSMYIFISAKAPVDGAPNHVIDAVNVYDEISNNYHSESFITKNDVYHELNVLWTSDSKELSVGAETEYSHILPNNADIGLYEVAYNGSEEVYAPITKGDVVGEIVVLKDGEQIYKTNAVALEDKQYSDFNKFVDTAYNIVGSYGFLFIAILLLVIIFFVEVLYRRIKN